MDPASLSQKRSCRTPRCRKSTRQRLVRLERVAFVIEEITKYEQDNGITNADKIVAWLNAKTVKQCITIV